MTKANKVWKSDVTNSLQEFYKESKSKCIKCLLWVKCDKGGFCQCRPLFTFTCREKCEDYIKGEPLDVKKWERQK